MSRTVPAALLTALAQPEVQPFYAVELLFDSGAVRLWTGYGDRTINSQTYVAAGTLLNIQGLGEVADLVGQVDHHQLERRGGFAGVARAARAVSAPQGAGVFRRG
jgi:hypothetical protein